MLTDNKASKTGVKSPAERHSQRRSVAFYQGFGEVFAIVGKYGEIHGGAERYCKQWSKMQHGSKRDYTFSWLRARLGESHCWWAAWM